VTDFVASDDVVDGFDNESRCLLNAMVRIAELDSFVARAPVAGKMWRMKNVPEGEHGKCSFPPFQLFNKKTSNLSIPAESQLLSLGISKNKLMPRGKLPSRSFKSSARLFNFSVLKEFTSRLDKSFKVSKTSKCVVNLLEFLLKFRTARG
jgi:hypothetical protein